MPQPSPRPSWLFLAALLPPLGMAWAIWAWGVDLPYWDQWRIVRAVVADHQGATPWAELWRQHNEHRLFVPQLVMLGLARLSGWNIRWEMGASWLLACTSLAIAFQLFRRPTLARDDELEGQPAGPLMAFTLSLLCFSFVGWRNFFWGWQLAIFLNVLGTLATVHLLSAGVLGSRRLLAAAGMAAIATFSFANGVLLWPLGYLAIWLKSPAESRRAPLALWSALTLATGTLFLAGYQWPAALGGEAPSAAELLRYGLAYLATPLLRMDPTLHSPLPSLLGLALLATALALGVWAWRERERRLAALPGFLLVAYTLGSALLSAWGRGHLGAQQAQSFRYATLASLFLVGLLILLAQGLNRRPGLRRGILAAVALALAANSWRSIDDCRAFTAQQLAVRHHLQALPPGDDLFSLEPAELQASYPNREVVARNVGWLRQQGLCLFRPAKR